MPELGLQAKSTVTPKKFTALTDRIKRDLGLSYAMQATQIGITAQYLTDCRKGRETPSQTIIVALRAVAADLPPLKEEG